MGKTFTTSDVASHNKPNDLYIVVDEDVYDLTKFQDEHPGALPPDSPSPNLQVPS
jgi:cytochrome b involved in lipid metabolism